MQIPRLIAAAAVLLLAGPVSSIGVRAAPLRGNILVSEISSGDAAVLGADGSVVSPYSLPHVAGVEIDASGGIYWINLSGLGLHGPSGAIVPAPGGEIDSDLALDGDGRLFVIYFSSLAPVVFEVDPTTSSFAVAAVPEMDGQPLSFQAGGLAVLPDGSFLVGPRFGNVLFRFDPLIPAEVFQTIQTGVSSIGAVDVDADGTLLIGDYDAPLIERRSLTGELLATYPTPVPRVTALAVFPIPEAGTFALVSTGLVVLGIFRRTNFSRSRRAHSRFERLTRSG